MTALGRILGLNGERATPQSAAAPVAATTNVGWSAPGMPQTPRWDADSAVELGYLGHMYSYRCARTIAVTLGSLPFRAGPNADQPNNWNARAPLAQLLGPAPGGPAPGISPRDLWIWSIIGYLVTGRFGWETVTAPRGDQVISLWPLVASRLHPIPTAEKDRGTAWFDGFEYWKNAGRVPLRNEQVFYAWRPAQDDWRQPESVLQAAALPLSTAISLDRFMYAYMRNGLSANKLVVTPNWDDPKMRRAFQDQFLSEMTGFENAGRVGFAEYDNADPQAKAEVQVLDLGTKPVDAQMLEQRKELKNDICVAYGVPMSMLGNASDRTFENADAEYRNYWTGTILPLAQEIADKVNLSLAPRLGDEVGWFDFSEVDALRPASVFGPVDPVAASNAGWTGMQDLWREDQGLPPLDPDATPPAEVLPAIDDTSGDTSKSNFSRRDADDVLASLIRAVESLSAKISGERYDVSPIGLGKNWVTSVGGLPLFIRAIAHALIRNGHTESQAIQLAVGVAKNWAQGKGKVTPKTRAKAAAAIAEWERKKAQAHATPDKRDAMVGEGTSAGLLLPKGAPKAAVQRAAHLFAANPADRRRCKTCGGRVTASVHGLVKGSRHAGPDHHHLPTGHVKNLTAKTRQQIDAHAAALEPQMADAMRAVFAKQAKATVDRMLGKRGQQMMRAAQQPPQPPQPGQPGSPPVNVAQVFDLAHWIEQTRQAVNPVYAAMQAMTADRLASGLHPGRPVFPGAVDAAQRSLAGRASKLADVVTQTTYNEIAKTLAEGLANGEGIGALTKRVRDVFDEASQNRAETIARTEVMSGINTAQDAYAQALPTGTVAEKRWLATPDNRTRPTHRAADGQRRPLGQPFLVGGAPMMHPGDPTAPPGEVIDCRCTTLYVPARNTQPAAAASAA